MSQAACRESQVHEPALRIAAGGAGSFHCVAVLEKRFRELGIGTKFCQVESRSNAFDTFSWVTEANP